MIRVLVVEDSPLQRNLLKMLLESDQDIRVIGMAENGAEGVQLARALKPDLITMDIRMPVMDGFEATRQIMQEQPTPIVVISASVEAPDLAITFNAIKAGALDVVEKPTSVGAAGFEEIRRRLIATVKGMAMVQVTRRDLSKISAPSAHPQVTRRSSFRSPQVLAIGASTGGPLALSILLKALPLNFSLPIVIIQHMATGFTQGFVAWLQTESALPLAIASENQTIHPGKVYFAPDESHLVFMCRGVLTVTRDPPVNYVRPSATVLFNSVAKVYGGEAIGVLLTGMGSDGAAGLQAMHQAGAFTVAQDEATSVVYGMPKVAAELGAVDQILSLAAIAPILVAMIRG
jgi:two-component system chemotaxis response regulator CheB